MSALYTQSSEERTFFSDEQITYVKREMNKQYTDGIMKLAGPKKKRKSLRSSFSLQLVALRTKNTKWPHVKTKA